MKLTKELRFIIILIALLWAVGHFVTTPSLKAPMSRKQQISTKKLLDNQYGDILLTQFKEQVAAINKNQKICNLEETNKTVKLIFSGQDGVTKTKFNTTFFDTNTPNSVGLQDLDWVKDIENLPFSFTSTPYGLIFNKRKNQKGQMVITVPYQMLVGMVKNGEAK